MYVGNYDFWYESSQLVQSLLKNKNKRNQEKIEELQAFISRFAANRSKSKQATSRRKLLDKLSVEEIPCSTRRYPFVGFQPERDLGKDILTVKNISKTVDGVKLLDNVYFTLSKTDKVALVGEKSWPKPPCLKSSWVSWSLTKARSNGACPPPAATCPRTTPTTLKAVPWSWWTGSGSTP